MTSITALYLHIPFCHRICPYCSFYKHTPGSTSIPAFLDALLRETSQMMLQWGDRLKLETIYWGGGTPSLLSVESLSGFLPRWLEILGNPAPLEWTVEMNPKTLTPEKVALFRDSGVTRASLGVQSWDPAVLQTLGRDHSPQQAETAYEMLRQARFPHIGIDHMFSVPGQSLESWQATLQTTLRLAPDHISCYNLTYEEDTAFFESLSQGLFHKSMEMDTTHYHAAVSLLEANGYLHYETSNYAQPGCESLHNSRYWSGADYLSLGPSAVSTVDRIRWKNKADTGIYTLLAGHPNALHEEQETLTEEQWRTERLALELRTVRGVSVEVLGPESAPQLAQLISEGLLEHRQNRIYTTKTGNALVDSIVEYLV
jgi:oxygen-independent coproporphyrinogen III oxidase